jgi:hypothetical protein
VRFVGRGGERRVVVVDSERELAWVFATNCCSGIEQVRWSQRGLPKVHMGRRGIRELTKNAVTSSSMEG